MGINKTSKLIIAVVSLFSCLSICTMLYSYQALQQSLQITNSLVRAHKAADELLAGSDFLTTAIRAYSVTGDPRYGNAFRREQFVTRSRDLAMDELRKVGLTRHEMELLEGAKRSSDSLIVLEDRAAAAAAAGDLATARSLALGTEYQQAKAAIAGPIRKARSLMETRIYRQQLESVQLAEKTKCVALAASICTALAVLSVLLVFFQRLVISPLTTLTRQVKLLVKERNPPRFEYQEERSEVGELARALEDYSQSTKELERQRRFRTFFDLSTEAVFIHDLPSGAIIDVNQTMCEMYGFSCEEVTKLTAGDLSSGIPPYTRSEALEWLAKTMTVGPQLFEWHAKRKDGSLFWVELRMRRITIDGHDQVIATARDITDRKRIEDDKAHLEEQLRLSQKMESIGRLAGGIAHDFNNMLSVISGAAHLSLTQAPEGGDLRRYLEMVLKAAERSSNITRRLLAFSRKEVVTPKPVNLNLLILESEKNLGRLIGEDVQLAIKPGGELWTVMIDPSQFDQILMNLFVNARDAMPDGGSLIVETANLLIEGGSSHYPPELRPGEYVQLTVSDTGCGMDQETRSHVFEPFFTTKGVGRGTGLGLATVYGIVTQNGGFIKVYSESGQGTVFRIFLPRTAEATPQPVKAASSAAPAGAGTILLVEDEELLLLTTTRMLEEMGYSVIQAGSPGAALATCESGKPIDLILTDVVMPEMNGRVMMERIALLRPGMKVLFMSGYTSDLVAQRGIVEAGLFIQKPFEMNTLRNKISEVMGAA